MPRLKGNERLQAKLHVYDAEKRKYRLLGLDTPVCTCVFENEEIAVLKIPAHKGWVARGQHKNYPTKYAVFYKKECEVEFEVDA